MSNLWNDIIEFWNKKYGLTISRLNRGATQEEFNLLENSISHYLPESFKVVYKEHNGCEDYIIHPHPSRFLSTEEILNQWNYFNQVYSKNPEEELEFDKILHSKEVKHIVWNKNWIPFTICTRGRDFYCLDFGPTEYGNKGQIIFFSMDLEDTKFVASSFEQWIDEMYSIIKKISKFKNI